MPLDAENRTFPRWRALLTGAGLGLTWGVVARVWMRLISTSPEFSVVTTAFILGIAAVFGTKRIKRQTTWGASLFYSVCLMYGQGSLKKLLTKYVQ